MIRRRALCFISAIASVVAALIACTGDDPVTFPATTPDAGSGSEGGPSPSDGGGQDGGAGTSCDPDTPFANPQPLANVNATDMSESHASLTDDELTIVFVRKLPPGGGDQIMQARRASREAPWDPPKRIVPGVGSEPSINPDGLRLYYTHPITATGFDIWVATRASVSADFGNDVSLGVGPSGPNSNGDDLNPSVTPDETEIWFTSLRDASPPDIYRAPLGGVGSKASSPVVDVNTPARDTSPLLSRDKLTLYYRTDVTIDGGGLYTARRESVGAPFGQRVPVATLDVSAEIGWISVDGCRAYVSIRSSGEQRDLYVASRPKP